MIDRISKSDLCTSCGNCFSVCPQEAISFKETGKGYTFFSDSKSCLDSKQCFKVCPGVGVDFNALNRSIFGSLPKNTNLGNFKTCYIASSKDREIGYNAASGGVATTILLFLLRERLIDGAVVTRMSESKPLRTESFIAETEEEIISARGSKYAPVPLNITLKTILADKSDKKYAFVGLPCHIHGLRKLQLVYPELKEKIYFIIGLFCGQGVSFTGTKFLLKYFGVLEENVEELRYRGSGWPGKLKIKRKERRTLEKDYFDYFAFFSLGFFTPPRCFFCPDFTAELADISLGDAWIEEELKKKNEGGKNIVVVRTPLGQRVFDRASNLIDVRGIDVETIEKNLWWRFFSKKNYVQLLGRLPRFLGVKAPFNRFSRDSSYQGNARTFICSLIYKFFFINSFLSDRFPKLFLKTPNVFWKFCISIQNGTYFVFFRFRRLLRKTL